MQNINIGICDDDLSQRKYMEELCERYFQSVEGFSYECIFLKSGEELITYQGEMIDLLFLDVEMEKIDGIQALKFLESSKNVWRIVFVSNHAEYVWDAFGKKTLGFECKPLPYERVEKWINLVLSEMRNNLLIEYSTPNGKQWIKLEELYYIEAQKNYVNFNTSKDKCLAVGNLKSWEQKLKDRCRMLRIHKAFLVNPFHIDSMKKDTILDNGIQLPLGRRYQEQAKKDYEAYIKEKIRGRL